eukprot:GHRR01009820.1.p1 GENE.GHRR01009820.1~~GHRR01009820.1.p1  ORF type:complete len:110 (-),score=17.16 GHRR01009820.1:872-1201(-)
MLHCPARWPPASTGLCFLNSSPTEAHTGARSTSVSDGCPLLLLHQHRVPGTLHCIGLQVPGLGTLMLLAPSHVVGRSNQVTLASCRTAGAAHSAALATKSLQPSCNMAI